MCHESEEAVPVKINFYALSANDFTSLFVVCISIEKYKWIKTGFNHPIDREQAYKSLNDGY